jgi:hypothetical protein
MGTDLTPRPVGHQRKSAGYVRLEKLDRPNCRLAVVYRYDPAVQDAETVAFVFCRYHARVWLGIAEDKGIRGCPNSP